MLRSSSLLLVALALVASLLAVFGRGDVSRAANGVVFTSVSAPDTNGVSVLQFTVNPENSNATITATSNGGAGHFTSAFSIATCPATTTTQQVTYQGACLAGAGPVGVPISGSAQWQCDSGGLVTFSIVQGVNNDSRQISCNTPTTTSTNNLLFVTASPNVVPCGGRTLITANIRNQTGQLLTNTVVHFATDQGLLDPSGSNTVVLTVYPGMTSARVQASLATTNGVITSDVLIQVFCPTPTVQGTPVFSTSTNTTTSGTTPGASTMTLSSNPGVVERCGGTVFVIANVKDAGGRPVGGAAVLFIATGGTISSDRETTASDGAATITFTADRNMTGSVKINAQAGSASGSVTIPIACTASESVQGGITTRPSTSASGGSSSSGSGSSSSTESGLSSLPPPISSTVTFLPPRTGSNDFPVIIRPPSTGDIGLKTAD